MAASQSVGDANRSVDLAALASQQLFRRLREPVVELLAKLAKVDWFRNATAASGAHDALVVGNHGVRRDRDDRNHAKLGLATDPAGKGKTVLRA
jgi:hypothetical protein